LHIASDGAVAILKGRFLALLIAPRIGQERLDYCSSILLQGKVAYELADGEIKDAEAERTEHRETLLIFASSDSAFQDIAEGASEKISAAD
jgi:hypothetical protein